MNVFVYGILMRDATEAAILPGYRVAFSGYATIREDDAARARGGLVRNVSPEKLASYDGIEGVQADGRGFYSRIEVEVSTANGLETAWAYRMNDRYFGEHEPTASLLDRMEYEHERLGHLTDTTV